MHMAKTISSTDISPSTLCSAACNFLPTWLHLWAGLLESVSYKECKFCWWGISWPFSICSQKCCPNDHIQRGNLVSLGVRWTLIDLCFRIFTFKNTPQWLPALPRLNWNQITFRSCSRPCSPEVGKSLTASASQKLPVSHYCSTPTIQKGGKANAPCSSPPDFPILYCGIIITAVEEMTPSSISWWFVSLKKKHPRMC